MIKLFESTWENGEDSVNDIIRKWLNNNGHDYYHDKYRRLTGIIEGCEVRFDYQYERYNNTLTIYAVAA